MKLSLFLATSLLLGVAAAQSGKVKGTCPPRKGGGGIGLCVFNPDINCTGDEACSSKGQLCCPDGCNRSCQDPVLPEEDDPYMNCPPTGIPPSSIGVCVFDPKVNCVENTDCASGEVCCPQGCNKICKQPLALPPRKPTPRPPPILPPSKEESCPPAVPSFGACVFDPSVNCLDSSACANGQVCCSSGCGKICKDPVGPKLPPTGTCPAAKGSVGICSFVPGVNCVDHGDCKNGKLCCSVGCGRECVNPEPVMVHAAIKP